MNNTLLSNLNPEQRRACENYEGVSLVLAGAGSGKTRVLTFRIAHMIDQGILPYHILALTFTNKAAREMKERIAQRVGDSLAGKIWMGTFHSIFARILRYEADKLGFTSNFTIYDTTESKNLIKKIIEYLQLGDNYIPKNVLARISHAKNNLYSAQAYRANVQFTYQDTESKMPELYQIYQLYAQRCRVSNTMDFDDLLLYVNILFKQYPEVLSKYQEKFKYILVDEYQDTNYAQYMIIKRLSEQHQNICVVGDDAQSIYAFRGANVENILRFNQDYKNCQIFKLEQNYRSTQNIVDAANSVIAKNNKQLQKKCFSENNVGEKIQYFQAFSDQEEVSYLMGDIAKRMRENKLQYRDIAILYRTHALTRTLENGLQRHGIPYKVYAGTAFYERKEVKDLMAYIKLTVNPSDDEAFLRVVNYPLRGIGNTTTDKLLTLSQQYNCSIWNLLRDNQELIGKELKSSAIGKLSGFIELIESFRTEKEELLPQELVLLIANKSGIIFTLKSSKEKEEQSRLENIEQVINGVTEFCELYIEENGEQPTIENYLESVALLSDSDTEKGESNKISLMTIHAAKGLEFDWVYIIGMEQGLFPSLPSLSSSADIEEERRLFYVALTRSKQGICISSSKKRMKWGEITDCTESMLLDDISPEYIDGYIHPKAAFKTPATSVREFKPIIKSTTPAAQSSTTSLVNQNLPNNFQPTPPSEIKVHDRILHPLFGKGKILSLELEGESRKAIIQFDNAQEKKTLLLRFAKMMVISEDK